MWESHFAKRQSWRHTPSNIASFRSRAIFRGIKATKGMANKVSFSGTRQIQSVSQSGRACQKAEFKCCRYFHCHQLTLDQLRHLWQPAATPIDSNDFSLLFEDLELSDVSDQELDSLPLVQNVSVPSVQPAGLNQFRGHLALTQRSATVWRNHPR